MCVFIIPFKDASPVGGGGGLIQFFFVLFVCILTVGVVCFITVRRRAFVRSLAKNTFFWYKHTSLLIKNKKGSACPLT